MGSTIKPALSRAFEVWVVTLNSIGTAWIFLLMLLINADVLARYLFNSPIDGVPEMVALSIVGIVFLQLSDAVRAGRLTRSDGFLNRIVADRPRLGFVLNAFYDLCGMAFFVAILFGIVPIFIEAYQGNYYAGTDGIIKVPVWPIKLILVISCVTVVAVFVSLVIRHVRALMQPAVKK
jgi:TRAP-type C4-dicarboxylate transport system permease small subunit